MLRTCGNDGVVAAQVQPPLLTSLQSRMHTNDFTELTEQRKCRVDQNAVRIVQYWLTQNSYHQTLDYKTAEDLMGHDDEKYVKKPSFEKALLYLREVLGYTLIPSDKKQKRTSYPGVPSCGRLACVTTPLYMHFETSVNPCSGESSNLKLQVEHCYVLELLITLLLLDAEYICFAGLTAKWTRAWRACVANNTSKKSARLLMTGDIKSFVQKYIKLGYFEQMYFTEAEISACPTRFVLHACTKTPGPDAKQSKVFCVGWGQLARKIPKDRLLDMAINVSNHLPLERLSESCVKQAKLDVKSGNICSKKKYFFDYDSAYQKAYSRADRDGLASVKKAIESARMQQKSAFSVDSPLPRHNKQVTTDGNQLPAQRLPATKMLKTADNNRCDLRVTFNEAANTTHLMSNNTTSTSMNATFHAVSGANGSGSEASAAVNNSVYFSTAPNLSNIIDDVPLPDFASQEAENDADKANPRLAKRARMGDERSVGKADTVVPSEVRVRKTIARKRCTESPHRFDERFPESPSTEISAAERIHDVVRAAGTAMFSDNDAAAQESEIIYTFSGPDDDRLIVQRRHVDSLDDDQQIDDVLLQAFIYLLYKHVPLNWIKWPIISPVQVKVALTSPDVAGETLQMFVGTSGERKGILFILPHQHHYMACKVDLNVSRSNKQRVSQTWRPTPPVVTIVDSRRQDFWERAREVVDFVVLLAVIVPEISPLERVRFQVGIYQEQRSDGNNCACFAMHAVHRFFDESVPLFAFRKEFLDECSLRETLRESLAASKPIKFKTYFDRHLQGCSPRYISGDEFCEVPETADLGQCSVEYADFLAVIESKIGPRIN